MKIGVFVGSFNPVHEGHIKVATYLLDNNYVDKVLMIATPNYWNKQDLETVEHRINMMKFYETDKILVDTKHNKYPYTYQILRQLHKETTDELYLIIGADNLVDLDKWRNIGEIINNNKIIVLNRNDIDINKYLNRFDTTRFVIVDNFPFINTSSTEIRNGNYEYLNEKIKKYIEDNKLYKK